MHLIVASSALVAALDSSERHHKYCVNELYSWEGSLLTCEAAISETCYVLRRIGIPAAGIDLLKDVNRGRYELPFQLKDRAGSVAKLMKKYADVPMSLADACLVDLATELKTGKILTLDSDFQFYRWGRNRRFDLTIDLD